MNKLIFILIYMSLISILCSQVYGHYDEGETGDLSFPVEITKQNFIHGYKRYEFSKDT